LVDSVQSLTTAIKARALGTAAKAPTRGRVVTAVLLYIACGFFDSGCVSKEDLTVWKAQVASPDGSLLASADTVQNGGFGAAGVDTSVYLSGAGNSSPPVPVLGFSCDGPVPRPYKLDNIANKGGTIDLTMKWITSSHLHVTYRGQPDLYLQTVRSGGIDITLQHLADKPTDDGGSSKPVAPD
jgi:hypothetical protein